MVDIYNSLPSRITHITQAHLALISGEIQFSSLYLWPDRLDSPIMMSSCGWVRPHQCRMITVADYLYLGTWMTCTESTSATTCSQEEDWPLITCHLTQSSHCKEEYWASHLQQHLCITLAQSLTAAGLYLPQPISGDMYRSGILQHHRHQEQSPQLITL